MLFIISLIGFSALSHADTGHDATIGLKGDEYSQGCWDGLHDFEHGSGRCLKEISSKWSGSGNTKLTVMYQNTCNHRIYAKLCNQYKKGGYDCGSDGIKAGSTKSWYTYNATGRYSFMAVGSDKPS